jgi:hypothetical protein
MPISGYGQQQVLLFLHFHFHVKPPVLWKSLWKRGALGAAKDRSSADGVKLTGTAGMI